MNINTTNLSRNSPTDAYANTQRVSQEPQSNRFQIEDTVEISSDQERIGVFPPTNLPPIIDIESNSNGGAN